MTNEKKTWFKLSPELVDGDHWTVVETKQEVLDAITEWFCAYHDTPDVGERFEIEVVEMTDDEIKALPEI